MKQAAPPPPQEQHVVDEEPEAPAVENAEAWTGEIKAYVAKLEKADNDLARIATGLALFSVVTSQPSFAWAKNDAIRYAAEGNRDRLLWLIGESMGALAAPEYGSLSEVAREATVAAFTANIDKVMGVLTGKVKIGRAPKGAKVAASPETAPAVKKPKKEKAAKKPKTPKAETASPAEPVVATIVAPPAPATNGIHHPEVLDEDADEEADEDGALA